jgi:Na+/H+-translocating membrane pyrophosphatase
VTKSALREMVIPALLPVILAVVLPPSVVVPRPFT